MVEGSPAYEAGVRDGDSLLQVDDVPATSWSDKWIVTGLKPGASEKPEKYSDLTRGTTAIDSTRERLGVRQTSAALGLLGVNESVPPRGTHSKTSRKFQGRICSLCPSKLRVHFNARSMLDSLSSAEYG